MVEGPASGIVVKQALPYLRLVGESWPLPLRRAYFERKALTAQAALAPDHVPQLFHFDETLALTAMAYLSPHIILRKGLIRGTVYKKLADHMATFLAQTLFFTSDLGQPAAQKKRHMAVFCDNVELCRITEDLVFTDPWRVAEANRWTTPQLDTTPQLAACRRTVETCGAGTEAQVPRARRRRWCTAICIPVRSW